MHQVGIFLLLALIGWTGCGSSHQNYTRIHDAAVAPGDREVVILVERGDATLHGNLFSSIWDYRAHDLAIWRLDRVHGKVARDAELKLPADFRAFYGAPTLAQFAPTHAVGGKQLQNCYAALTRCGIRQTPAPYVIRDITGNRDRGLTVIDPQAGVAVRGEGSRLLTESWTLRTPDAVAQAASEAMRASVQRIFDAARRVIAKTISTTGALPTERTETIIETGIAEQHPGLMPEYYVDAGGVIGAQISYANEPPTRLRWTPSDVHGADGMPESFTCEADRAEAAKWFDGCKFSPKPETLDPELIYLMERMADLRSAAAQDPAFQRATRGVTFGIRYSNLEAAEVWLSCLGLPGSRVGQCDIDRGDTACSVSLPLLCLQPDETLQSPYADSAMRERWLAARVAASQPVRGDALDSAAAANARCAAEFGPGWRLASWSDHGEGFIASGKIDAQRRLWINATQTYKSNCWDRQGATSAAAE
jgi:hypothetical protein